MSLPLSRSDRPSNAPGDRETKSPEKREPFSHSGQGLPPIKPSKDKMSFISLLKQTNKKLNDLFLVLAQARSGPGLPGNCLSPPTPFFLLVSFRFTSMPNNRPIARTRMKGRLLPNLEVHRSLQAPNRGCSRNPETEQAGVTARAPSAAPRMPSQRLPRHRVQANIPRHRDVRATRGQAANGSRVEPPATLDLLLYKTPSPWDLPGNPSKPRPLVESWERVG